ncbi:MAG: ribosome biogenesis GTPase Der [Bacillota bacterium]
MAKPIVAIVGRPNVGKSTFFNYVAGKRISIVEDTPGVTRDRIYVDAEWRGRTFTMIDTGGIEPWTQDHILQHMKKQAEIAVETADVIVFMVDSRDGVTATDLDVANMLRKSKKPLVVAVNKVDRVGEMPAEVYEFYNLGIGEIYPVSSVHGLGMGELLDACFEHFPEDNDAEFDDEFIKVAVVGKPNAGKSSLINKLLGEERVIVSDIPGTTRDAIDTIVEDGEDKFVFIDTAGIRKKSKITAGIEKYSSFRSFEAIDRSDVCLIMIDAEDGVTEQDTKIAGYAHDAGKASVIVVNKWDLLDKVTGTLEEYAKQVHEKLGFMQYAPVLFISAKTGQRVNKLFENIKSVNEQSALRISTGMLNDFINEITAMVQPPSDRGKRLKIYYMTQVSVKPPAFVIFLNNEELMHYSYQRYIENQLRKNFGFAGTPIQFSYRQKGKKE